MTTPEAPLTVTVPPSARVASYVLTLLPIDDIDSYSWAITVAERGSGKWAVCMGAGRSGGSILSRSGDWTYEPNPSSRTDEWLTEHRFDLQEALDLAHAALPEIRINGMTTADVIAWHEERSRD